MGKPRATPNMRFRAARERHFGSREALAEAANVHLAPAFAMSASDIGKIERGVVTCPREPRRAALRKVLRAGSDADIGLFDSRRTQAMRPRAAGPDQELAPPTSEAASGLQDPLWRIPGQIKTDAVPPRTQSSDHLHNLSFMEIETPVPSYIGWPDVEHVRFITRALALSENTYGGGFSGQAAAAQLRHSAQLIRAQGSEDVLRAMHEAVGNLGGVVGFSAFDVADYRSAYTCFEFQLWCAEESASWALRANALSDMARLAMYLGKYDDALSLIEYAQVRSDRIPRTMCAMLCAIRARLLAIQGRNAEAWAEVSRADEYFSSRKPDEDPPWISYYSEAEHQGSTGKALIAMAKDSNDLNHIAPRLERAIQLHDEHHPRSRAFSRTRLASIVMKIGDPSEAASIGSVALAEASTLRFTRLRKELENLATLGERHAGVPAVADLQHQITDSRRNIGTY